jgi:hypothetical protein
MTDQPAGWEPFAPADVRDERRIRDARRARLEQHLRVRVRCTSGQLHTIELRGGRLTLLNHTAAERCRLPVATASWAEVVTAMRTLPRCLQVLQAWRDATARPGNARKVKATKARPEHWKATDPTLPPRLRAARGQTITDGAARRDLRTWLGWPALRADNAAGRFVEVAVRCEYARYARPSLLLEVPVDGFTVNATPYDPGRALGTVHPQPDYDDFGKQNVTRLGGISVGLRYNWLATLWWRGLGVVDGRLVLDVRRQPHCPHAGRQVATLIDWAGDTEYGGTTTRPGWVSSTNVPLLRDQAGRWHLAYPAVGTTMRRVDWGRR